MEEEGKPSFPPQEVLLEALGSPQGENMTSMPPCVGVDVVRFSPWVGLVRHTELIVSLPEREGGSVELGGGKLGDRPQLDRNLLRERLLKRVGFLRGASGNGEDHETRARLMGTIITSSA